MDEKFMNRFTEVPDCQKILRELESGSRHKHELTEICDVPEKIDDTLDILIGAGMAVPLSDTGCYRISFDALNCLGALDNGMDEFLDVYSAWYSHGNEFMAQYLTSIAESLILGYANHEDESQTDLYDYSTRLLERRGFVSGGVLTKDGIRIVQDLLQILFRVVDDRYDPSNGRYMFE